MFEEGWWDKHGPLSLPLHPGHQRPAHKQVWVQCSLELP